MCLPSETCLCLSPTRTQEKLHAGGVELWVNLLSKQGHWAFRRLGRPSWCRLLACDRLTLSLGTTRSDSDVFCRLKNRMIKVGLEREITELEMIRYEQVVWGVCAVQPMQDVTATTQTRSGLCPSGDALCYRSCIPVECPSAIINE